MKAPWDVGMKKPSGIKSRHLKHHQICWPKTPQAAFQRSKAKLGSDSTCRRTVKLLWSWSVVIYMFLEDLVLRNCMKLWMYRIVQLKYDKIIWNCGSEFPLFCYRSKTDDQDVETITGFDLLKEEDAQRVAWQKETNHFNLRGAVSRTFACMGPWGPWGSIKKA